MFASLVDPLQPAIETWLAIYSQLPLSIRGLIDLTLGIFAVVVCFKALYHLRGG